MKKKNTFNKYDLYERAVQSPRDDVLFVEKTFKELKGKSAKTLREDFCGTFQLCCEWAKLQSSYKAFGVDIDPEPIDYGRTHHFSKLSDSEKKRVHISEKNVLSKDLPLVDVTLAQNFSYYLFKEPKPLKKYFKNVYDHLKPKGVFFLDSFGGPDSESETEESAAYDDFTYYWDQIKFNPITRYIQCAIHFKLKNSKKQKEVFSYDWRLWTLPEIKQALLDVGFKKVHIYWEGVDSDGEGNGIFSLKLPDDDCETCDSWVAYLVAEK